MAGIPGMDRGQRRHGARRAVRTRHGRHRRAIRRRRQAAAAYLAGDGWTATEDDGALRRASICAVVRRAGPRQLQRCDQGRAPRVRRLHGPADESLHPDLSVMNSVLAKNDRGNRIPLAPTACDAAQAVLAAAVVGRRRQRRRGHRRSGSPVTRPRTRRRLGPSTAAGPGVAHRHRPTLPAGR